MGGMQGFGPVVVPGSDEPYHHEWESRILALNVITGFERLRVSNGRADREEMDPAEYLAAGYFDRWVWSIERGLLEHGTIAPGEIEAMIERLPGRRDGAADLRPGAGRADPEGARRRADRCRPPSTRRSRSATGCACGGCGRRATTAARATCAASRASSNGCSATTAVRAPAPSRSTWWRSTPPTSGVPDADRGAVLADLWEGYLEAAALVDGVHDVGGMQGFGAACWPGSEEPTHADWELRAFVLALVTGPGSSHAFRHTIERLDPVRYLSSGVLRALAVRGRAGAGRVGRDHARARSPPGSGGWRRARRCRSASDPRRRRGAGAGAAASGRRWSRRPTRGSRPATACGCGGCDRPGTRAARATCAARAARSRACRAVDGVPDVDNAADRGRSTPSHSTARELWGDDVERHVVHADLWERYLEPDHV